MQEIWKRRMISTETLLLGGLELTVTSALRGPDPRRGDRIR